MGNAELLHYLQNMTKPQAEINQLVERNELKSVQEFDITKSPNNHAILKEAFGLYPPAIWKRSLT